MDLRETYDKIAEQWDAQHEEDTWWIEGADKFLDILHEGATVLDLGCGSGAKSRYMADRGFTVVGTDISEEMLRLSQARVPQGKFCLQDMREITDENIYDGILAQASLLHLKRSEAPHVVARLARALKHKGLLYIAVKKKRVDLPEEGVKVEDDYGFTYERFFSYYTIEELKGYIEAVGLKSVWENESPSGRTTWVQVIAKKINY